MSFRKIVSGSVALSLVIAPTGASLQAAPATTPMKSAAAVEKLPPPADVDIGGEVVMRIRSTAGQLTPTERAAHVTDRLTRLVAVPDLTPADVVVYTPDHKPPVIYVLGRKLITVDNATAAASGAKPIDLATQWAKQLQQVLPRVDIRLQNEPEPVISADPPLTITSDFNQVGGQVGDVILRDKLVMRLRGPQPHGMTAAERADVISALLASAIHATQNIAPTDIKAVGDPPISSSRATPKVPKGARSQRTLGKVEHAPQSAGSGMPASPASPSARLMVGDREIITVTPADALAAGVATPLLLAEGWAKNIRNVVFPPPSPVSPTPSTPVSPQPPVGREPNPSGVPSSSNSGPAPSSPAAPVPTAPPNTTSP